MSANSRQGQIARTIWERVAHFEMPPTPTAARALLKLQFSESDRQRMQELSAKARSGELSVDEDEDEEATIYEQLGCLLDVLHSQARRSLKRPRAAS